MTQPSVNALEVRGLSKSFGAQRALKDFDLEVRAGEIHALVGENGCGKSTTVKCLSGYHQPDPGAEIVVAGQPLPVPYGPGQASAYGLSFVHQDLGLVPTLSVAANLTLGRQAETGFAWRLRERREAEIARGLLARLGREDIDPRALVKDLSRAGQTVVAIARCLHNAEEAQVMVLDEPTAALPAQEVERLLDALRRAAAEGHGILYISHRLEEVFSVTDRVTILRDGLKVGTYETAGLTQKELVGLMVGRTLEAFYPEMHAPVDEADVVLRAKDIRGNRVRGVSLSLRRGEVVGVAGLVGAGKSELGRLLFGAQRLTAGELELDGETLDIRSPADAIAKGIALVPADRHREGTHLGLSIVDNVTLPDLADVRAMRRVPNRRGRSLTASLLDRYDIRPRDPDRPMAALSGGNQQKAVLAKWMHRKPAVLILDDPTQGIDIGAKTQVYGLLEEAASEGMAVLVISEEFEDLSHICDRVLVMRRGQVVAELTGEGNTGNKITDVVYQEDEAA